MKYFVLLHGRGVQVEVSKKAEHELKLSPGPVVAVVHLIFGCMVAKRVWFRDKVEEKTVAVTDKLSICFDVVRYANCSLKNIDGGAEPERLPLKKSINKYVPDALFIDFRNNSFSGDFTFSRSKASLEVLSPEGAVVMMND